MLTGYRPGEGVDPTRFPSAQTMEQLIATAGLLESEQANVKMNTFTEY